MLHSTRFNDIIVKGALISNVKKMHENSVFRNDQSGISKYHNVLRADFRVDFIPRVLLDDGSRLVTMAAGSRCTSEMQ